MGRPRAPESGAGSRAQSSERRCTIDEGRRPCDKLRSAEGLSNDEIVFALISTEVNFASDRWGAGYEWETVSGYSDTDTIARLRKLQLKLVGVGTWPW